MIGQPIRFDFEFEGPRSVKGRRVCRDVDGFIGIISDHSAWSTNYWLVEDACGERVLVTERSLKLYWSEVPLPALLANHREVFHGRAAAWSATFRWLCEQLVRALLWGAWLQILKREGEALDRAFLRFCRLVEATPIWPCRVDYQHPGLNQKRFERGESGPYHAPLCITAGQAAQDAEEMIAYEEDYFS